MGITTHVDGVYAIKYDGTQNLQNLANKYGVDAKQLLFKADREDDSKEGTAAALVAGDVIIINADKVKTIEEYNYDKQLKKDLNNAKEKRDKHNKTHIAAVSGVAAAAVGAWTGFKIGTAVTGWTGPVGAVIGGVIGAAIGVGIALYEYNVSKNNQELKELEGKVNNIDE